MTSLTIKTTPKRNNTIYSVRQQIQALGFSCSTINQGCSFSINTTDGEITIGSTKTKNQLALIKPHNQTIFVNSDKLVGYFKDRLDLRDKALPHYTQENQDDKLPFNQNISVLLVVGIYLL